MIGTAARKEYSAAVLGVNFSRRPPTIVAPERLIPGHRAVHWNRPIRRAFLLEMSSRLLGWDPEIHSG